MNKTEIIKFLAALFGVFQVHGLLGSEISASIAKSGYEKKFFNLLLARLHYLKDQGINAVNAKEFEPLSNTEGLYSMHLTGKGFNYRIIYSFLPDRSPVLLLGFSEKSGKKVTDYTYYIPEAEKRLSEMLEAIK